MSKAVVLIYLNNIEEEALFALNIETYLGVQVQACKNYDQLLETVRIHHSDVQVVLMDNYYGENRYARDFDEFISDEHLAIRLVIRGQEPGVNYSRTFLKEKAGLKDILKTLAGLLKIKVQKIEGDGLTEFYPVTPRYVALLKGTNCDVYINIAEKSEGQHFVKRLYKGENFTENQIATYIKAGLKNFYVKTQDRMMFTKHITKTLVVKLAKMPPGKRSSFLVCQIANEIFVKHYAKFGITDESIKMARMCIDLMKKNTGTFKNISELLKRFKPLDRSFRITRIHLIIYLAGELSRELKIYNDKTMDLLAYAAFFQDISLEEEYLSHIESSRDFESYKLTPEQRRLVENHAQISSEIVEKIPSTPMNLSIVIKQHHGSLNGDSFPQEFDTKLFKMSQFFLVLDSLAFKILAITDFKLCKTIPELDGDDFDEAMKKKFSSPRFNSYMRALKVLKYN